MSDAVASVCLVAGKLSLQASGSEVFVREQVEWFRHTLLGSEAAHEDRDASGDGVIPEPALTDQPHTASNPAGDNPYPNVFSFDDSTPQILLSEIPGRSKQLKMRNVALLTIFGRILKAGQGHEKVSLDELKQTCQTYGCLDRANFSKVFRDNSCFLKSTNPAGMVGLSVPGQKEARKLADSLNNKTDASNG